jgi:hypothetical protein
VASHIIDQLIAQGHAVTGSIRSASKGEQILATHPEWAPHLNFVILSDYTVAGTWDAAFRDNDFDYVAHTAPPLLDNPKNTDSESDFLKPGADEYVRPLGFGYWSFVLMCICTVGDWNS